MKPPNPLAAISFLFSVAILAGIGFLYFGSFHQSRDITVSIWYVEEIEDPYGSGAQVIQVTYKDIIFQDKVIIFYKTDLSGGLAPTKYRLIFETSDKLWAKTHPWTLLDAYPVQ